MHDVISIGNAIVDLIGLVDHETLDTHGLTKGSMMLVDAEQSAKRSAILPDHAWAKASGGSAANTAACLASLNARSAYIGKVGADALGAFFADDMKAIGVDFIEKARSQKSTANCLAMITPDGERTMSTYLGACQELSVIDVDHALNARILFLEGYLLDAPRSYAAVVAAAERGRHGHLQVAITLSDRYCVERNRRAFEMLVDSGIVDTVIGNETEVKELCKVDELVLAGDYARAKNINLVTTLGKDGSVACDPSGTWAEAEAANVSQIVDLIGAGDAFAAGFLLGQAYNLEAGECLRIGNRSAAVVVESKGARPHTPLSTIFGDGSLRKFG
jgi:sugar/nucleoside kinase (ribokinase family)